VSDEVGARFKRSRRGPVTVTFDEVETAILDHLLGQLLELLETEDRPAAGAGNEAGGTGLAAPRADSPAAVPSDAELNRALGIGSAGEPPADPALARLFPDGYREDAEAAADFRRYTEPDLREGKRTAARTARETLGTPDAAVQLDDEQARCWLASLNDLRLAIGTRLEVTEDTEEMYARLAADDARRATLDVYLWLGYLQETLVDALT
jgi:hypothetical protein